MQTNNKKSSNKSEFIRFITYEIKFSALYLCAFLIETFVMYVIDFNSGALFPITVCLFCFSSFLCGFWYGIKNRKNGLLNAVIYIMPINILIILISILFNKFSIDVNVMISFFAFLFTSILGGVTGVNVKIKKQLRRK